MGKSFPLYSCDTAYMHEEASENPLIIPQANRQQGLDIISGWFVLNTTTMYSYNTQHSMAPYHRWMTRTEPFLVHSSGEA
eukprot:gene26048-biopygen13300